MKRSKSKAQASVEVIVILAIVIAAFAVVLLASNRSLSVSQSKVYHDQGRVALDVLSEEIERVYAQGVGARSTITIRFPPSTNSSTLSGKDLSLFLFVSDGQTQEVYRRLAVNASGSLPQGPGLHSIAVVYQESGVVLS